jgi:hypothetical protein
LVQTKNKPMKLKAIPIVQLIFMVYLLQACSINSKLPVQYYNENKAVIEQIESNYSKAYSRKPFAIEFTGKDFNWAVVEMKNDSLRYLYEFNLNQHFINDTLLKYGYDTTTVLQLIRQMKTIRCTWMNHLDYYTDGTKKLLIFMSVRHKALDLPFSRKKYFILTFYKQPQYYDAEGRLLDRKNRRRLRIVNNEVFRRINDKVCYTLSDKFR